MAIDTVLFDLDDTLIVEEAAAEEAFLETCRAAEETCGVPAQEFSKIVRETAREHWHGLPTYEYCRAIGVSSWEGLWIEYAGEHEQLRLLGSLAGGYRFETWNSALMRCGADDAELARRLAGLFPQERRKRHRLCPDATDILNYCRGKYKLGMITNGAPGLQREKIEGVRIGGYFGSIVISGDVGFGKPDSRVFAHALEALEARPEQCVMVGDTLRTDIAGANGVGIRSIWLNRSGRPPDEPHAAKPDAVISTLGELKQIL